MAATSMQLTRAARFGGKVRPTGLRSAFLCTSTRLDANVCSGGRVRIFWNRLGCRRRLGIPAWKYARAQRPRPLAFTTL